MNMLILPENILIGFWNIDSTVRQTVEKNEDTMRHNNIIYSEISREPMISLQGK
jgi:hypothetical protein